MDPNRAFEFVSIFKHLSAKVGITVGLSEPRVDVTEGCRAGLATEEGPKPGAEEEDLAVTLDFWKLSERTL